MGAVLVKLRDGGIFKNNISSEFIGVKLKDFPSLSSSKLILITNVLARTAESSQFFLTFDDVINHLHFGKGLGSILISGEIYPSCKDSGGAGAINAVNEYVSKRRGSDLPATVSFGSASFSGPIQSYSIAAVASGDMMPVATFSIEIGMTKRSI